MATPPLPHVVVVGGGFAGRRAERLLAADGGVRVTLLDAASFFEYTPAALRCCVRPAEARACCLPQPARCRAASLVGVELSPGGAEPTAVTALRLADGSRLACDYVLFATGSSYSAPIKADAAASSAAARAAHYRAVCVRLEAAPSVLVVGGGTVGVELAAEVACRWRGRKAVTLVASSATLLPRMPPAAGAAAERFLRAAGVTLLLGERVADWGGADAVGWGAPGAWRVTTASGRALAAGCVFSCAGGRPRAEYLAAVPGALTRSGAIAVLPTLQCAALRNAFAAGDVAEHGAEATALAADLTAELAAHNLLRLARGQPLRPLGAVPAIAAVSLGATNGVLQFNSLVLAGPPAAALKWVIQRLQLGTAAEWRGCADVWGTIEAVNIFLGRRLFLLRAHAAQA